MKINVGCGYWVEPGWVGLDVDTKAVEAATERGMDVRLHDVTTGFPFGRGSAEAIYSEDFIEHVFPDHAEAFFANAFRTLRPRGVIRTATPDLQLAVREYMDGTAAESEEWAVYNKGKAPWNPSAEWGTARIEHPCEALNTLFSWWGHHWIYDEPYLRLFLERAGFVEITRRKPGESCSDAFVGVDRRKRSLILEAVKP
jgi:predicted SAM-dependent methyltransferase